jgi:Ca2+-dependent lipid-binding protein
MSGEKLVIRLHEARGLSAADWNGFSDPFCEARIKNDSVFHRTKG